ncbi:HNH endonuclease signature motif containing protein [Sphingobium sp. WTD-1]|uniref:HNH endonuclease n=1 Tax=Sphingobium sp. WTD-1 TaxID=2979467 RepID=UPI0024DE6722|nr:HNH endonuclease signature motif containing protein [Sphingobium sp. WTD-1]WIA58258.1 HNH endonuclease signature motif containing protein [Sphingobium sp. WTD-1]
MPSRPAPQRTRTERLRGRAGQAQRRRRLQNEPLCRDCADKGIVTASTVPDHIVPLAKGGSDDDGNIRCLCGPCHEIRTAEQFGHKHQARLGACDATGMPTDPDHPWNRPRG